MVYHVTRVGNSTTSKTVFISFFLKWGLFALLAYVVCGSSPLLSPYMWWVMLGMAFPAAIGAYFQLRHIRKNTKSYEDTFYTLTEGGVMMEGDKGQACLYFSWGDIREARRVLNHTVWMQLENGKSFNCLLEGLPEERIAEFARFAAEHAGKTPPASALTMPPAELTCTSPLRFSGTPEQRREHLDAFTLLSGPAWGWTWLRPCMLLLWGVLLMGASYRASYLAMAIVAAIIWRCVSRLKNPGGPLPYPGQNRPGRYYASARESLQLVGEKGTWIYNRRAQLQGIYETPHGVCIHDVSGTVVMVDAGQPLPPHLQAPRKRLPRHLSRPVIHGICGLFLLGAAWCFTQSNTWRLHRLLSSESPDVAEALSLAKLPPNTQVSGVDILRNPSANILFHRHSGPFAASICFDQPDGSVIYAHFDKYGELVHRKTY